MIINARSMFQEFVDESTHVMFKFICFKIYETLVYSETSNCRLKLTSGTTEKLFITNSKVIPRNRKEI